MKGPLGATTPTSSPQSSGLILGVIQLWGLIQLSGLSVAFAGLAHYQIQFLSILVLKKKCVPILRLLCNHQGSGRTFSFDLRFHIDHELGPQITEAYSVFLPRERTWVIFDHCVWEFIYYSTNSISCCRMVSLITGAPSGFVDEVLNPLHAKMVQNIFHAVVSKWYKREILFFTPNSRARSREKTHAEGLTRLSLSSRVSINIEIVHSVGHLTCHHQRRSCIQILRVS
mmetsp:Transcript_126250/g.252191  ORF Transcript_126250/g.252191 Transcript_126250/m.252191 type:complete len:228 (+) Transcript_126250:717-1400(+)